jgi:putative iron-regulated protein
MRFLSTSTAISLVFAGFFAVAPNGSAGAAEPAAVLKTYSDIALAKYEDSLASAKALQARIRTLIDKPSAQALAAARNAWKAARVPYQQSEVYRFGNKVVDDWEGQVNSWPLDEGMIDYVDTKSYGESNEDNPLYTANVIANPKLKIGGEDFDATVLNGDTLRKLHEADEVEANVATGYHAIEFLLWGQDLNGTKKGAGNRPWTDYAKTGCTHGNCDRRGQYLAAAVELLVEDLEEMVGDWKEGGSARAAAEDKGLSTILIGMGSLSYGELAGERMKLGLMLHDPEEEHDCFSDNTHNSHYYDALGIRDAYLGSYKRADGKTVIKGASLSDLVKSKAPAVDAALRKQLQTTMDKMTVLKKTADSGEMAYDQMIGEDNPKGNAIVQAAIDALLAQTKGIEKVVESLNLDALAFEGSDSLDEPQKVFK